MNTEKRRVGLVWRGVIGIASLMLLVGSNAAAEDFPTFPGNTNLGTNTLSADQWMLPYTFMESNHGEFQLYMQGDGNLVLYWLIDQSVFGLGWYAYPIWASGTDGYYGLRAVVQQDGNLVLYDGWVDYGIYNAYWASNTQGNPGATLVLQDDGNLVIYAADGRAIWATGTAVHPQ